jgi:hypothetical protein
MIIIKEVMLICLNIMQLTCFKKWRFLFNHKEQSLSNDRLCSFIIIFKLNLDILAIYQLSSILFQNGNKGVMFEVARKTSRSLHNQKLYVHTTNKAINFIREIALPLEYLDQTL